MDNYPESLSPKFSEFGGIETPFEEWWPKVRGHFASVPENVARYWLYEHWRYSPYEYLPSAQYEFELVEFAGDQLMSVLSRTSNFDPAHEADRQHGEFLVEEFAPTFGYKTVDYILEHGDFPAPIIVLDNSDGHLVEGVGVVPPYEHLPAGLLLIEGHRRFNIAIYLMSVGRLVQPVSVWLMRRKIAESNV